MRAFFLIALLSTALAEGPETSPSELPEPEIPGQETDRQPAPNAAEAPAPAPPEDEYIPPAADVLDTVTRLLSAGSYQSALEISLPAISQYPAHASSFVAVAKIAVDQMQREPAPVYVQPARPQTQYSSPDPRESEVRLTNKRRKPGNGDKRKGFIMGIDLGTQTGVRGEFKLKGRFADSIGFKVGAALSSQSWGWNVVQQSWVITPHVQSYVDFQSPNNWQFELTTGFAFTQDFPILTVGAAIQYDPPTPLQINVLGISIGTYRAIQPEFGVSFLW